MISLRFLLTVVAALHLPVEAGGGAAISGVVHQSAPSADRRLGGVRIEAVGGTRDGHAAETDADGQFTLPHPGSPTLVLQFSKAGYETARVEVLPTATAPLRVALAPEPGDVALSRSGANACTELPAPPAGVPGLREYARLPIHHDGYLTVKAAQLPFLGNQGYVYRQTPEGWVANEADYVLIRTPIPVRGGFVYVITFGGDKDLCAAWSIDASHPR